MPNAINILVNQYAQTTRQHRDTQIQKRPQFVMKRKGSCPLIFRNYGVLFGRDDVFFLEGLKDFFWVHGLEYIDNIC